MQDFSSTFSFVLADREGNKPILTIVKASSLGIEIAFDGFSTATEPTGLPGSPVYLENQHGIPVIMVNNCLEQQEPTHRIALDGAIDNRPIIKEDIEQNTWGSILECLETQLEDDAVYVAPLIFQAYVALAKKAGIPAEELAMERGHQIPSIVHSEEYNHSRQSEWEFVQSLPQSLADIGYTEKTVWVHLQQVEYDSYTIHIVPRPDWQTIQYTFEAADYLFADRTHKLIELMLVYMDYELKEPSAPV